MINPPLPYLLHDADGDLLAHATITPEGRYFAAVDSAGLLVGGVCETATIRRAFLVDRNGATLAGLVWDGTYLYLERDGKVKNLSDLQPTNCGGSPNQN